MTAIPGLDTLSPASATGSSLRLATMLLTVGPREYFPLAEVASFWAGQPGASPAAFATYIRQRDGDKCTVKGCPENVPAALDLCHIIGRGEHDAWSQLKLHQCIPPNTQQSQLNHPGNGLRMCKSHHALFDAHYFFIRWAPEVRKYFFINLSHQPCLAHFHGSEMNLSPDVTFPPHPNLFLAHERFARRNPRNLPYCSESFPVRCPHPSPQMDVRLYRAILPHVPLEMLGHMPQFWSWESEQIQKVVVEKIIQNLEECVTAEIDEIEEADEAPSDGSDTLVGSEVSDDLFEEGCSEAGKSDPSFELLGDSRPLGMQSAE